MADDTRDIVIRTATEVSQLRTELSNVQDTLAIIKDSLAERRGAEKIARWLIGIASGGVGAFLTKFGAVIFSTPMPK